MSQIYPIWPNWPQESLDILVSITQILHEINFGEYIPKLVNDSNALNRDSADTEALARST